MFDNSKVKVTAYMDLTILGKDRVISDKASGIANQTLLVESQR